MMRSLFTPLLALLLTVAAQGKGVVVPQGDRIQHLHRVFHINNPNEDIRTNVLLNIEGL